MIDLKSFESDVWPLIAYGLVVAGVVMALKLLLYFTALIMSLF